MTNTDTHYGNGKINSMNGCGINDTSKIFYETGRHFVHASQEDELEGILDSGVL